MRHPSLARGAGRLLLWVCSAVVAAGVLIGILTGQDTDIVRTMAWHALIVELVLIYLPARSFMERRGGGRAFGFVRIGFSEMLWSIALGMGAFFAATAINGLTQLALFALHIDTQQLAFALPQVQGWRLPALLLLLAIIPAFAEETLFRGALLHAWAPGGVKRALWHCAALFALIHLQPQNVPALLLLGLLLGVVALQCGSVYPAMIVHGFNNLIAVLISSRAEAEQAAADMPAAMELLPYLGLYLLFGLAIGVPSYIALRRHARLRRERQAQAPQAAPADTSFDAAPDDAAARTGAAVYLTYAFLALVNLAVLAPLFMKIPWLG